MNKNSIDLAMNRLKVQIAKDIFKAREEKEIQLIDLSLRADVSTVTIRGLESGTLQNISLFTLLKVASALNLQVQISLINKQQ